MLKTNQREAVPEGISAACRSAAADGTGMRETLQKLYRAGFCRTGCFEGKDVLFAERSDEIFKEIGEDWTEYLTDPEQWRAVLEQDIESIPRGAEEICAGCGSLAAEVLTKFCMPRDAEKSDASLLRCSGCSRQQTRAFLHMFFELPLERLMISAPEQPAVPKEAFPYLGQILGMLVYISLKRNAFGDISPELSFDAVSVLAAAAAETIFLSAEESEDLLLIRSIAAVSMIRTCQWMHQHSPDVLRACMADVPKALCHIGRITAFLKKTMFPEIYDICIYCI